MRTPPRIGILCLSAIADDPRVRRQGDLLAEAGWHVVAIGLPGARSAAPPWICLAVGSEASPTSAAAWPTRRARPPTRPGRFGHAKGSGRGCGRRPTDVGWLGNSVGLGGSRRSSPCMWISATRCAYIGGSIRNFGPSTSALSSGEGRSCGSPTTWTSLPIAKTIAEEQGVPYAYDTHELAVDEYAQRVLWRILQRPVIAAIEVDDFGSRMPASALASRKASPDPAGRGASAEASASLRCAMSRTSTRPIRRFSTFTGDDRSGCSTTASSRRGVASRLA